MSSFCGAFSHEYAEVERNILLLLDAGMVGIGSVYAWLKGLAFGRAHVWEPPLFGVAVI